MYSTLPNVTFYSVYKYLFCFVEKNEYAQCTHCVRVKVLLSNFLERSETHANVEMLHFPLNEKYKIKNTIHEKQYCVRVIAVLPKKKQ